MRVADRGFTLIEVMVALIIVGLAMMGAIQIVSQAAGNSGYLRDKSLAHWVAMNKLTEVRLLKTAAPVAKSSDEVEMGGRKWKWTMNVTQTAVETMRRIDISVRPEEAAETVRLASITGFYGTSVAPPGSTLLAWQGSGDGGPQSPDGKPGKKEDDEDRDVPPGVEPPPDEPIPEPEEPPDSSDPSDPTQH